MAEWDNGIIKPPSADTPYCIRVADKKLVIEESAFRRLYFIKGKVDSAIIIREDSVDLLLKNNESRDAALNFYNEEAWNKNPGLPTPDRRGKPLKIVSSKVFLHATTLAEECVTIVGLIANSHAEFCLPNKSYNYGLEKAILKAISVDEKYAAWLYRLLWKIIKDIPDWLAAKTGSSKQQLRNLGLGRRKIKAGECLNHVLFVAEAMFGVKFILHTSNLTYEASNLFDPNYPYVARILYSMDKFTFNELGGNQLLNE
jgi:hypothetical protein